MALAVPCHRNALQVGTDNLPAHTAKTAINRRIAMVKYTAAIVKNTATEKNGAKEKTESVKACALQYWCRLDLGSCSSTFRL